MTQEPPKTAGSFGSNISHARTVDEAPTQAELNLIRKLRTLQGADYEAQYYDRNSNPSKELLSKMGNPTPLAIAAFGITNTIMSLMLMNARGAKELNVLVGSFWFVAGLLNVITCIFELLIGNTFAYTIFGTLGGYFMSLGVFFTPAFGIVDHYSQLYKIPMSPTAPLGTPQAYDQAKGIAEFHTALGIFNLCWACMFLVFFLVALRTNVFMIFIFGCVSVTCVCTGVSGFYKAEAYMAVSSDVGKIKVTKEMMMLREDHEKTAMIWDRVGGGFLLASSIPNWYLLFMILALTSGWKIKLPTGELGAHKAAHKKE
ncbi:hypothetical protein FKW77_007420 [Venturia effusa]|uniref:Uncharacterized protein n=1 Tax=Venturia effusa TaxID=50376 RepID=A0A517LKH8_9PEZI|nr:hypothetical protein FKW77_007420 [Venturia effusa]